MNVHADFETLIRELRNLRPQSPEKERSQSRGCALVFRRVDGLTPAQWQEFCRRYSLGQWGMLPLPASGSDNAISPQLADTSPDAQPLTAQVLASSPSSAMLSSLLSQEILTRQLERELQRILRNGGELTLLCCALVGARLEAAPGMGFCAAQARKERHLSCVRCNAGNALVYEALKKHMECCDSVGMLASGFLLAILPGYGLLRGRMLADNIRTHFRIKAKGLVLARPGKVIPLSAANCAFGIVNARQSDHAEASGLIQRAVAALEKSWNEPDYIYYDAGAPLAERATLVHSQEKRFLFFGGD